jgi:hypothetical protein
MKMSQLDWVAWLFVVIGAINWGFVGLFKFNLVEMVFGGGALSMLVYMLVGLSGLYMLWMALSKKK